MGTYINIGNAGFQRARNGEYVDKSGLIAVVDSTLNTEQGFSCVTRSRRFGKSMAAKMLVAYYDQSCDSRHLFADLEIANDPTFEQYLNKYAVISLDISDFVTRYHDEDIVGQIDRQLKEDVLKAYPDFSATEDNDLMDCLINIVAATKQQFIFVIDEWDAICREFTKGSSAMDRYVNWLRRMFKGGQSMQVFAGVYMTGILPIKKYATESALNNFIEYSMVNPGDMAQFFGFTKEEVRGLAAKYSADVDELVKWYAVISLLGSVKVNTTNVMHREMASGKGFADIVLIPRKHVESPAIVLELKYNQDADTAISQIKRQQYPAKIAEYTDNLLLVGINYDKQQKKHDCRIEHFAL